MQNLCIYPEIDRIRRSAYETPVLIRICPYTSRAEIEQDMYSIQQMLIGQFNEDGEALKLTLTAEGRRIYATKHKRRTNG